MHMCRDWPVATRIIAVILDVRPMQDRVDPSWPTLTGLLLVGQVLWSGVIVLCPSGWVMR